MVRRFAAFGKAGPLQKHEEEEGGGPYLICLVVSVDAKHHVYLGRRSELRSCVKVQVAVLGSSLLISLMVSVDGKQH